MKLLFCLFLILAAAPSFGLQIVNKNTIRLRILSYNIKGLPELINPGWDEDRFEDIGAILAARKRAGNAPDLVFLQEAFGPRTIEVQSEAGYKYVIKGPSNLKPIDSGLYILSNFPIAYEQSMLYGNFDCGTWDCWASKGAMMARVTIPGVPFFLTVGNTHAQSGRAWNEPRTVQLRQFAALINSLINPGVGVIVGGDFNSNPSRSSYGDFVRQTKLSSAGEVCLNPANGCALLGETNRTNLLDKSEDQFFYAGGRRVSIHPVSVERNFAHPVKGRMLSDHLGYETVFEISWM